ncbi:type IV pilus assembly protein PilN [Modicisalibacter muralis]|uniref:Type IV pilus assembly protein PilN n=1 Tax=Modicisalibacter muralis TaxID=119000 RepID=A0A1G9JUN5_9GAMM|nr:PilN domain-containing protein [Halomonas muralis]SDL40563.1 type IV pilus assembly protein PilN [Halomonas muralis]
MSIEINLLPWREELRERRSRRFLVTLALVALIGVGAAWGASQWYQHSLELRQQRIAYIKERTQQLDSDIQAILDYQTLREQMLTQIELIRELQFSRPQTVRVFNQLAASLEQGVYYTRLSRQADQLNLTGLAETNRQVSDQMRAIAAARAFAIPVLSEVQVEDDGNRRRFDMSVEETLPETPGDAAGGEEAR